MFAVFNRFNPAYEEAARDLGASGWQAVRHVDRADHPAEPRRRRAVRLHPVLRRDRADLAVGRRLNTLPLELQAMQTNATTPVIYALGAMTTGLSLAVIGAGAWRCAGCAAPRPLGSDAGKAVEEGGVRPRCV